MAVLALGLSFSPAYAKHHHKQHHTIQYHHHYHHAKTVPPTVTRSESEFSFTPFFQMPFSAPIRAVHEFSRGMGAILPHPDGCPHVAFCGCGAAHELGIHDRSLWLARSWYRFPRAAPAPGTVAVRSHHVFVLREHVQGDVWLTANYNGGRHLSKLEQQSIRGYTIVRPRE